VSFGISLTVIANVGIASVNAFSSTLSDVTHIKIGFFIILINTLFSILYFILTKGKYVINTLIQILSINILGFVVNFFVYTVFDNLNVTSYIVNVLILVLGIVITAVGVSVVTLLNVITFSIESACHTLEKLGILSFFKARMSVDIIFISLSIIFYFVFETTLYIREGTLIAMILFSSIMKYTLRYLDPILNKVKTLDA
jgi:uncharacterized membrane protein YczE